MTRRCMFSYFRRGCCCFQIIYSLVTSINTSLLQLRVPFTLLIKEMAKKIVMKVQMSCQKCRSQALQVVAQGHGVVFVGLEGEQKDKVVVVGNGVDAVELAIRLRKKVGHTEIISVADVNPK